MNDDAVSTDLARARDIARILDSAVGIPGTRIRFGLDALLGLVPGLGDVTGAAMAGYLVVLGARLGVPGVVIARMVMNTGIDMLIGAIPLLGDLFDIGWRSNSRNLALLERALERRAATRRSSAAMIAGAVGAIGLLAVAGIAGTVLLIRALIP